MWKGVFGTGILLLCMTLLLYRGAVVIFRRGGLLLWDPDRSRTPWENVAEFFLSVFLSLMVSAALGFLFVGLLGFFGVPISVP